MTVQYGQVINEVGARGLAALLFQKKNFLKMRLAAGKEPPYLENI
jgi:hypothetical protein